MRILLLGDSTVAGSVTHFAAPKADHLEDVVRKLLEGETGFPPIEVINEGADGETILSLLADRYENITAKLSGKSVDFIFIRYGINDLRKYDDFPNQYPEAYRRLLARLREDYPHALITLETAIPYSGNEMTINEKIQEIAEAEGLPVLDIGGVYAKELKLHSEDMGYRKIPLKNIPENLRSLLPPGCESQGVVFLLDDTLDVHFRDLPGWIVDHHPTLIGYHVMGKAVAEYLTPILRKQYPASVSESDAEKPPAS